MSPQTTNNRQWILRYERDTTWQAVELGVAVRHHPPLPLSTGQLEVESSEGSSSDGNTGPSNEDCTKPLLCWHNAASSTSSVTSMTSVTSVATTAIAIVTVLSTSSSFGVGGSQTLIVNIIWHFGHSRISHWLTLSFSYLRLNKSSCSLQHSTQIRR